MAVGKIRTKFDGAVRQWIRELLWSAGYVVFNTGSRAHYAQDSLFTSNNDHFRYEPEFKKAYSRGISANGGHDPHIEWRVHVALWAARNALRLPGSFVECGVNAGFVSSAIMHRLNWHKVEKHFYLVDTFNDPVITQYSEEEIIRGRLGVIDDAIAKGAYVTDLERVRANYAEWPNVEVVQGIVPDVLPSLGVQQVAFLHIDMNCAFPERAALEYFWELLSPGAIVLLDDYAYFGYEAQGNALDGLAHTIGATILALPTGQGMILK